MAKNAPPTALTPEDRTCCGVIENAKNEARAKRSNRNKPQPWFALKITILFALGIIGYASYVYVGRICKPMLQRSSNAFGSRELGIAFLVVFSVLLLMMTWTYIKVVVTPPGFAKNHVGHSDRPTYTLPDRPRESWTSDDIGGTSYENMIASTDLPQTPPPARSNPGSYHSHSRYTAHDGIATLTSHGSRSPRATTSEPAPLVPNQSSQETAGVLDAIPGPIRASRRAAAALPPQSNMDLQPGDLARRPPRTPILIPAYRFCSRDELIKPPRTHHCRSCGTCVLKFDHHCPWIGQCVGARNHKFFVNFLQWASAFCIWTFATLVALIPQESKNDGTNIDPQHIVVIALAGLFFVFTVTLLLDHIRLICLNQTTVESLGFRDMREQERAALGRAFSWYQCGAKRRKKREWNEEWGAMDTEGNLWWLGSSRTNWESVMGKPVLWWILPIGRSASDGLEYPTNPRFDAEGRWRRRKEWPEQLQ